jgi:hypothetical protein
MLFVVSVFAVPWIKLIITFSISYVIANVMENIQLVKKLSAFYGNRNFITVFTRAFHLSLSEIDESSPRPYNLFL